LSYLSGRKKRKEKGIFFIGVDCRVRKGKGEGEDERASATYSAEGKRGGGIRMSSKQLPSEGGKEQEKEANPPTM